MKRQDIFEREILDYFSTNHVFTLSSGKAALTLILMALSSRSHKREVIIPAYTCYSVAASIARSGLSIKLCDIDPATLDYDYDVLETMISANTLCVITSNLFGRPCNITRINALKRRTNVTVIEDVAQAMGGEYDNKKLGTYGDVAFFSLGRGKNVTCGSGGIIITNNESIATALDSLHSKLPKISCLGDIRELVETIIMSLFLRPWLYCLPSCLPFLNLGKTFYYTDFKLARLSLIKSWLMRDWQSRLSSSNKLRQMNSTDLLGEDPGFACLRIPYLCADAEIAELVKQESSREGLGIVGMYPSAICDIPELSNALCNESCDNARFIARRLVTVPSHQLLGNTDKKRIHDFITKHQLKPLLTPV